MKTYGIYAPARVPHGVGRLLLQLPLRAELHTRLTRCWLMLAVKAQRKQQRDARVEGHMWLARGLQASKRVNCVSSGKQLPGTVMFGH